MEGKMKKPFILVLALTLLALTLSGCIKSDGKIRLNSNGTIELDATLLYKKQVLQQLVDMQGGGDIKDMLNIEGQFTDMAEGEAEDMPGMVFEAKEVEDEEFLGIGMKITYPDADSFVGSELRRAVLPPLLISDSTAGAENSFVKVPNAFGARYTINTSLDLLALTQGQQINPDDEAFSGIGAQFAIEVPAGAAIFAKHNADSVQNGSTFVWEAAPDEPADIAFTVFVPSLAAVLGSGGVLIILIGIILLVVFLARRKPKDEFYMEEGEADEAVVVENDVDEDEMPEMYENSGEPSDEPADGGVDETVVIENDVDEDEMPKMYENSGEPAEENADAEQNEEDEAGE